MNRITMEACLAQMHLLGRTLYLPDEKILYMNWTCSGVEFTFTGTELKAEFRAVPGAEIDDPVGNTLPPRPTWPWVGVVLDDAAELSLQFELREEEQTCVIFSSDIPETHKIRLVKLTENPKGMAAIRGFEAEGEITSCEVKARKLVEFVGDSITCGFGNMSNDRDRLFFSEDENGWYSHAAIAGRLLDMDTTLISYSGICTENHTWLPQPYGMNMLYEYRDRVAEDKLERELTPFDFSAQPRDYVVINLGTNDATGIMFAEDHGAAVEEFKVQYRNFIEQVRRANGPETTIICALGSIFYMLYSDIEKIVEAYKAETGDTKIHAFRYFMMAPLEGIAPCGHPTKMTQERMGREIADLIRSLEEA